jgi:RecA/RadA recombinase
MHSPCLRFDGDAGVGARDIARSRPTPDWFNARELLRGLRRVNVFCGGFGSGKTEVAVNFCLRLRALGHRVSIADLDIVNLYFRSREVRSQLRRHGVEVIVPAEALVNADLPIVQPEIKGAMESGPGLTVLDLGGDPAGAKVMASLAESMRPEDYSGLFVLNSRRPFTATVAAAKAMMAGITAAARIQVDRIVVNSHLIDETTPAVIEEGIALGESLAKATGARIAFVAVQRALLEKFDPDKCGYPVMVLDRLMLKPWEPSNWLGKYRVDT